MRSSSSERGWNCRSFSKLARYPFLLLAWALLVGVGPFTDGNWERLETTSAAPSERGAPAVAAIASSVYVFGGVLENYAAFSNTFYNDLYEFDTTSNVWTQLAPAGPRPPARTFAAAVAHEPSASMLIFGGSEFDPTFTLFTVFDDFWSYSVVSNSWTKIEPDGVRPQGRSRPNLWVDGDEVYLFGGITQNFEFLNDLWVYDLGTNRWTELIQNGVPGNPPGRHLALAGTTVKQGRLTIHGGETLDFSTFQFVALQDTWRLDLDSLTWTDVTPALAENNVDQPRNLGAAGLLGAHLLMTGGDVPGGEVGCGAPFPQNPTDELWDFHLVQKRWRLIEPSGDAIPPLKNNGAAVVDERLYVFSGWDFDCADGIGPGQVWNIDVWVFSRD